MIDELTDIVGNFIGTIFPSRSATVLKRIGPKVEQINSLEPQMAKLSDKELRAKTDEFRKQIAQIRASEAPENHYAAIERFLDGILPEAFAVVREAGKRTLGMRHFDVQLIGGM